MDYNDYNLNCHIFIVFEILTKIINYYIIYKQNSMTCIVCDCRLSIVFKYIIMII